MLWRVAVQLTTDGALLTELIVLGADVATYLLVAALAIGQ